ncbi:MAG TPA: helix-turn-helix domain-containing protein [Gaiellales bacterium]|jgi:excisionase family DNA binding protein|nr:helix-turn-helix domain-containing protein [Gaiellales bacterium]
MRIGTARDVAELLQVRVETVYAMAQAGELPQLRRVGVRLRFDLDRVEEWMREGEAQ